MCVESIIRDSEWWRRAVETPDRHEGSGEAVTLADHLERTLAGIRRMLSPSEEGGSARGGYADLLVQTLEAQGFSVRRLLDILVPAALLHDIGKLDDDKESETEHPITGKAVARRHPVVGVIAATDILPEGLAGLDTVLALVDQHDTPYSWYRQFEQTGSLPATKSWAKLDRKIDPEEDGTGIVLLALLKLADADGHEDVSDVAWFFENANSRYLLGKGKWLPVPSDDDILGPEGNP
jgi:hypothetical protein